MSDFKEVQQQPTGDNKISRRSFLIAGGTAAGAFALWSLHRSTLQVEAAPISGAGTPKGMVTVVDFDQTGKEVGKVVVNKVVKTEDEWKKQLSPGSYEVTRHEGTERAYTGSTWDEHAHGIFRCICCDLALFSSETKFESGTGWPSFWKPIAKENVSERGDGSLGMQRTEVKCRQCDGHLGHVFDDGPRPTGLRYCMNSAAMKFVKV